MFLLISSNKIFHTPPSFISINNKFENTHLQYSKTNLKQLLMLSIAILMNKGGRPVAYVLAIIKFLNKKSKSFICDGRCNVR